MRKVDTFRRGCAMIAEYYYWGGIAYDRQSARLRYVMMRVL
jgi:hypothetical protein